MKHRGYVKNIGGTSDAGKAGRTGVIGGIGGIGAGAPACAREACFYVRAYELFPARIRKDTSDASDKSGPARVSDIGGTSDVFGVPPMFGFCGGMKP